MNKSYDSRLLQTVYSETLENGLTVILLPQPGFQQVFASLSTRYGSVDTVFRTNTNEAFRTVPDGIAHFLEHKMFESPTEDVFAQFAKFGAFTNAFTSADQTTYYFSCTNHVAENVNTLLNFVQEAYLTKENVEKEKGIIGQEIRMYDDDPEWRAMFGLLKALFKEHPVRVDIAGTVESIADITVDTLYDCYNTFYHPSNMVFAAAGGFDADEMMEVIVRNQAGKSFSKAPNIARKYPHEEPVAAAPTTTARLPINQARCLIGWKEASTGLTGKAMLFQEMVTGVILDALFGKSSELYHSLIDEEIIDQRFSWEYEVTEHYGYSLVGGNSSEPEKLAEKVNQALQVAADSGLPEDAFERSRKKTLGRFITSLDSPDTLCRTYSSYWLKGVNVFDAVDVLNEMTKADADERLRQHFTERTRAVSLVLPK